MAKKIVFDLDLELGDAEKQIQDFVNSAETARKKLKELERAAIEAGIAGNDALAQKFKKAAGELKDQIADTKEEIGNFASDTRKLDVAVGSVQGLVGAFTAVQGAVGLLGSENEDLQKTIAKVTSSLAVLNGIQQVATTLNKSSATGAALYAASNKVLAVAVGQSTGALKVFRTALLATGIGVVVVSLGLLITNWEKVTDAVLNLIPGLKSVGDFFGKITNAVTDFVGITSDGTRELDMMVEKNNEVSQSLTNQIKVLEAAGGKEKEIFELKKKLIFDELAILAKTEEVKGKLSADELKRQKDLITELQTLQVSYDTKTQESVDKSNKERGDKEKKAAEDRKKSREAIRDAQIRSIEDENKRELAAYDEKLKREIEAAGDNEKLKSALVAAGIVERNAILIKQQDAQAAKEKEAADKEKTDLENKYKAQTDIITAAKIKQAELNQGGQLTLEQQTEFASQELLLLQQQFDAKLLTEAEYVQKKKEINDGLDAAEQALADKAKEREQKIADFRQEALQNTFSTLTNLNQAFANGSEANAKKAFENGKKIQIAEALISTYLGATKAYSSQIIPGDPTSVVRGAIAAGVVVAAGLANVARIKSTKFTGGGGGAGGEQPAGGLQNPAGPAPFRNPFEGARASGPITPEGRPGSPMTQRVYVLESDITSTQNRVKVIETNSNGRF